MKNKTKIRAVDFFSGAGGMTYGLRQAGIEVVAGVDNDPSCKETYEKNNPGSVYLCKDVSVYSPKELQKDLKISKKDDGMIFVGCAPCQYWSIIRTTKEKAKKTKDLIVNFRDFVDYFLPGYVIVENVPGFSIKKESPMKNFIDFLTTKGYDVNYEIVDMSWYGIPQMRKRFTLVASRVGKPVLPKKKDKRSLLAEAIGEKNGFLKIKAGHRDETSFVHTCSGLSEKNLERLRMTPKDGGNRDKWQKKKGYDLNCYIGKENQFKDNYARMSWNKPAPTITTKFFSISNGRFAHPEENRAISLREGASLQTFPKNYKFISSSIAEIAKMIGNAVPPKFAKQLGDSIVKNHEKGR